MRYSLALALLLTGCAHTATSGPAVETKIVTVTKEVQKPCPVTPPVRPAPLARPLPTDAVALAALLGEKLGEYAFPGGYADKADSAIKRCITPSP